MVVLFVVSGARILHSPTLFICRDAPGRREVAVRNTGEEILSCRRIQPASWDDQQVYLVTKMRDLIQVAKLPCQSVYLLW